MKWLKKEDDWVLDVICGVFAASLLSLLYGLAIGLPIVDGVVHCVERFNTSRGSFMEDSPSNALDRLQEAVDSCIEEFKQICADGYHKYRLGRLIADCYTEGWRQEDIEAVFKDLPCSWRDLD